MNRLKHMSKGKGMKKKSKLNLNELFKSLSYAYWYMNYSVKMARSVGLKINSDYLIKWFIKSFMYHIRYEIYRKKVFEEAYRNAIKLLIDRA